MKCPFCGNADTAVKDSRPFDDNLAIRRRRECTNCGQRFTTFERIQLRDLKVVKRNGERLEFEREKLERSVRIALRKRPLENDAIEQMISRIVQTLEASGDGEISTQFIGRTVMNELAVIDPVAYIRFASVYRDFQNADDFAEFLQELQPKNAQ